MKKIFWIAILSLTCSMAQLKHVWATPQFVAKKIKIIDIRTPLEWYKTGIIKDSYPLTFFDKYGNFNLENFLKELDKVVQKNEQFALICRVGSRTSVVAEFLSTKLHYNVINLKGGITKMMKEGYKTVDYSKRELKVD